MICWLIADTSGLGRTEIQPQLAAGEPGSAPPTAGPAPKSHPASKPLLQPRIQRSEPGAIGCWPDEQNNISKHRNWVSECVYSYCKSPCPWHILCNCFFCMSLGRSISFASRPNSVPYLRRPAQRRKPVVGIFQLSQTPESHAHRPRLIFARRRARMVD